MGYVKAFVGGLVVATVAITSAQVLGPKLPDAIKAGSVDLRPFLAGGATVAVASALIHHFAK